jgi:hypothetical protein
MGMTMVIARMDAEKIERGNRVLAREGLTASEAINLMYDRIIADQSAAFLIPEGEEPARQTGAWQTDVVDAISEPCTSRCLPERRWPADDRFVRAVLAAQERAQSLSICGKIRW